MNDQLTQAQLARLRADRPVQQKAQRRFERRHSLIWDDVHERMLGFANLALPGAYDGGEKISPELYQLLRENSENVKSYTREEAMEQRAHITNAAVINLTAIDPDTFSIQDAQIPDAAQRQIAMVHNQKAQDKGYELAEKFLIATGELCGLVIEEDQLFLAYTGFDRKPHSLERICTNLEKESLFEAFFENIGIISEADIADGGGLENSRDWAVLEKTRAKVKTFVI